MKRIDVFGPWLQDWVFQRGLTWPNLSLSMQVAISWALERDRVEKRPSKVWNCAYPTELFDADEWDEAAPGSLESCELDALIWLLIADFHRAWRRL